MTRQNCKNVKKYERLMMKMGTPIEMTKKGKTKKKLSKTMVFKDFQIFEKYGTT